MEVARAVAHGSVEVPTRTNETGTTYTVEHEGRKAKVRFYDDGRVHFSLDGRWMCESVYAEGEGAVIHMAPRP
jgi:hypothetical protein